MAKYRFDPDGLYNDGRYVWILDLNSCELQSGQEFDPAEFGRPDWKPEPYPHPLFLDLTPAAKSPPPVQESAPAPTPSVVAIDDHAEEEV